MKYSWLGSSRTENTRSVPNNLADIGLFGDDRTIHMENKLQAGCPTKKIKRFRSAFTTDQVNYLEQEFRKFPYIGNGQRKEVAIALNIPERAVKIWFQNRRMKEKKDGTQKELVEEQTSCKTQEYDKDQLFNVSTQQSTNEQQSYSLPLLATTVDTVNKLNIDKSTAHERYKVVIEHPIKANYYKEVCHNKPQEITPSTSSLEHGFQYNISKNRTSPSDYKSSAEFSINLCKRYKNECDNGVKLRNDFQRNYRNEQNLPLQQKSYDYQDSPEDLSSKKQYESREKSKQFLMNTPELPIGSNYFQQSFVPPGGVMWKPINVIPIMPTSASAVTISANNSSNLSAVQEQNERKRNCNCDCHVKTYPIPIALQQSCQNQHYIITAVPFQNASSKF